MLKRFGKAKKRTPPPPPPAGQMTDLDYDEVSPVGRPANGEMFYVRKGDDLSPEEAQKLKEAGLKPPQSLEDVVAGIAKSSFEQMMEPFNAALQKLSKFFGEGEPMLVPNQSGEPGSQQPQAAPAAKDEGDQGDQSSQSSEQPVQRELTDADLEQVRTIAKEVSGSLIDERFSSVEERIAAIEKSLEESKETTTETAKSLDAVRADLQKAFNYVPAPQGDGDRLPPEEIPAEEVAKAQSDAFWTGLAEKKPRMQGVN